MFDDNSISVNNAPWWLPHSTVALKGVYLAEDDAAINNQAQTLSLQREGTSNATLTNNSGSVAILKVQRMVTQGTVAVMMRGGKKHEVSLPTQANKLSILDLNYIIEQIDALSQPMSAEEQAAFLASANGRVEGHLSQVR